MRPRVRTPGTTTSSLSAAARGCTSRGSSCSMRRSISPARRFRRDSFTWPTWTPHLSDISPSLSLSRAAGSTRSTATARATPTRACRRQPRRAQLEELGRGERQRAECLGAQRRRAEAVGQLQRANEVRAVVAEDAAENGAEEVEGEAECGKDEQTGNRDKPVPFGNKNCEHRQHRKGGTSLRIGRLGCCLAFST